MGDVKFIGRVGALAFALGLGAGLAATPWAASAETSDSGSSSSGAASTSSVAEPSPSTEDTAQKDAISSSQNAAPPTADDVSTGTTTVSQTRRSLRQGATRLAERGIALSTGGAHEDSSKPGDREVPRRRTTRLRDESAEVSEKVTDATVFASPADGGGETPVIVISGIRSTVAKVLAPLANDAPNAPTEPPTLWTVAAFARRELGQQEVKQAPTVDPLVGEVDNGLVTELAAIDTHVDSTAEPATFTGEPSFVSRIFTATFRVIHAVGNVLGMDLRLPLLELLSAENPPWFTTRGLNVHRSEFEGMPVWILQSPGSTSEEIVVAIHGGAYIVDPGILHWLEYAPIARDTGATVMVPIYPLAPEGGTAGAVVPAIANLISSQIDEHGAENVSVLGDSAGGAIGLSAVQELVRRGDPVPSGMVLISPALDLTLSNPAIQFVDDPLFTGLIPTLHEVFGQWRGELDLTDPLVSPFFGSLEGLPPTTVYAGSFDIVAPDVLVLQDKSLTTPGADFTFVLRSRELHAWAAVNLLPETQAVLPDIYRQLGIDT